MKPSGKIKPIKNIGPKDDMRVLRPDKSATFKAWKPKRHLIPGCWNLQFMSMVCLGQSVSSTFSIKASSSGPLVSL